MITIPFLYCIIPLLLISRLFIRSAGSRWGISSGDWMAGRDLRNLAHIIENWAISEVIPRNWVEEEMTYWSLWGTKRTVKKKRHQEGMNCQNIINTSHFNRTVCGNITTSQWCIKILLKSVIYKQKNKGRDIVFPFNWFLFTKSTTKKLFNFFYLKCDKMVGFKSIIGAERRLVAKIAVF